MLNSKPIHILRTFDKNQMQEFERYIHSSLFNVNKAVIQLFEILKEYFPDFTSEKLNRTLVAERLFGEPEENKLRYAASDLAKLLEDYIMWHEFQKSEAKKRLYLLDYYRKTDLEKYFYQIFDEATKQQIKDPIKDSTWFFNQYLLEENVYMYSQLKKSRSLDNNLQTLVNYLDLFYISNKLKHSGEMLTREALLRVEYKKPLLSDVLRFLELREIEGYMAVEMYFCVVQMHLQPESVEYYYRLLTLLDENRDQFSREELVDLYVFAQNYCTARINAGKIEFLQEVFNLFKKMIELEAIYDDVGHIRLNVFKNIVTVGIRLGEFDFVEQFIENYKNKLEADKRESAILYNTAWLQYARRDFKSALRLLSQAEFADIFYLLGSKCLQLKIFYETDDQDAFYALCESFYVYLRRNKVIAEFQKEAHLEFIKYIKQLARLRSEKDTKGAEKLHTKLSEQVGLIDRTWFLRKLEEIKQ
ncbi:MAG: hypothetical protein ACT6RE_05970 [Flavobacteriales bacterium]